MTATEAAAPPSERKTIGPDIITGLREVLAYERGERNGMIREGRRVRIARKLARRQRRTHRTSHYRIGATLVIRD